MRWLLAPLRNNGGVHPHHLLQLCGKTQRLQPSAYRSSSAHDATIFAASSFHTAAPATFAGAHGAEAGGPAAPRASFGSNSSDAVAELSSTSTTMANSARTTTSPSPSPPLPLRWNEDDPDQVKVAIMRHRLAASAGSQYKGLRKTLRRRISALEAKVAQKVDGSSTNILDSVRNNGVADDEEMEQHMRQLEWLKAAARDGPDAARPIDATIAIAVSVYAGLSSIILDPRDDALRDAEDMLLTQRNVMKMSGPQVVLVVSSAAQHCRSQSSRKPGYAVLEELSKHGAFVRAPRTLSPSELTSLLDDLAWMRMPLTPRAGRALRARVAEVAADLLPHEVARCIIAISELQRALREDHRHWSKVKRRRVVRGHGLELWKEPPFLYSFAQLEARIPEVATSIAQEDLVGCFIAYAKLRLEPNRAALQALAARAAEIAPTLTFNQVTRVMHSAASLHLSPDVCQHMFAALEARAVELASSGRYDDVGTFLWACAAVDCEPWTTTPLVPFLIERVNAVQSRSFSHRAVTNFYQSVHRFSQLGLLEPASTGVENEHHKQRTAWRRQSIENAKDKVSAIQQAVYDVVKVVLPDAESEVLLPDKLGGLYEVDIFSKEHNLVLEVDGIHHFVHPPASPDATVMANHQLLLWFSTVAERDHPADAATPGGAGGAGGDDCGDDDGNDAGGAAVNTDAPVAGAHVDVDAAGVDQLGGGNAEERVTVERLHAKLVSSWDFKYLFASATQDAFATPTLLEAHLATAAWVVDVDGGNIGQSAHTGGAAVKLDLDLDLDGSNSGGNGAASVDVLLSRWRFKELLKVSARKKKGAQNHPDMPAPWAQRQHLVEDGGRHWPIQQTGASTLKRNVLQHSGIKVQSVPWYDYQYYEARGNAEEYISALVASTMRAADSPNRD